ncbi:diaminopropionate ammonia-lyase [Rhodobacterales bacterium HKCCSP123]|nr:diaminopropionate ammonia-lyase [Rhodobacterales bacterium HKCCSP123]
MPQPTPPHLDADRALLFHGGFPRYRSTPLLKRRLGDRDVLVKDETGRMGLGAFKAIGGTYAVAVLLARALGLETTEASSLRTAMSARGEAPPTFVCASAGNHGMAVAFGAQHFGARCRIHLSDTVPQAFVGRLEALGAEVVRSGATYEESIAAAIADAEATGAIHLADGSWPGYTEPPRLVMEGYTVMAEEMRADLAASGHWPSHVYLQAGVGGMAAAVAAMIRRTWAIQPEIVVVEPEAAPCLRDSARAGEMVKVDGPVSTMGRLDCKAPSMLAFEILRDAADRFVTVTDAEAGEAARIAGAAGLGATTPSGAAGLAALLADDATLAKPPTAPLVILSEGAEAA